MIFPIAAKNGWTESMFVEDGLLISAVSFYLGDPGEYPLALGYTVGENDGRSTLYPTVQEAIVAYRNQCQQADGVPA